MTRWLLAFLVLCSTVPGLSHAQESAATALRATEEAVVQRGHELVLDARLTEKGDTIERGMVWRIFADQPDEEGELPLLATKDGGTTSFMLPTGAYLVHAGFGRASATKRVVLEDGGASESFVLDAGGLQLNAVTAGLAIPPEKLRFSIYGIGDDVAQSEESGPLIAGNVPANRVIRLKEGTYHVVSQYGRINASVRADLEVTAGKVTQATLQHRGAAITLKLVSIQGGDPVANTAWTVLTEQGEKVFESNAASPALILSEGVYEASVRNGDDTYVHNFEVQAGIHRDIEILLGQ